MRKSRKISCFLLSFLVLLITAFSSTTLGFKVSAATSGYVDATDVYVRADATTASERLDKVSNIPVSINSSKIGEGGYTWYNVTYTGTKGTITGYIRGDLIKIIEYTTDTSFETQLNQFPDSYRSYLRQLHAEYPNWSFYADKVSMSLSDAVSMEMPNQRKVTALGDGKGKSYFSMDEGAYDWTNNKFVTVLDGSWVYASRELISYYMDPRNFLNDTYIYTFLQQGYNSSAQNAAGVSQIIKNTFLANGYYDPNDTAYGGSYVNVIMEAARQSGVSPYVIAATIIQEQGKGGTSQLISGTTSYGKVYNFFNVQASGSDIVGNGLTYAKSNGWTTRSASIIGGAKFMSNGYISNGQDTYYYMNYNVLNPDRIWKQYAQAVHNAANSGKKIASTYSANKDAALTFRIPVYTDIPSTVCEMPGNNGSRNNYYFKSIEVSGLTPSFTMYRYNYDLSVSGNTTVNVRVPDGAKYVSASSFDLSPGENHIVLTVKAETCYTTNYYIDVYSSTNCTLYVSDGTSATQPGGDSGNTQQPSTPSTPSEPSAPSEPSTPSTPSGQKVMRGDTNGDGKISLLDLANVQRHLLGIITLDGDNFKGADTNGDNKISLIDLANVQKHLLGVKLLNQ